MLKPILMLKPIVICGLLLIGVIITVGVLNSCAANTSVKDRPKFDRLVSINAEKISIANITQFIQYIEARDIDSAKAMFSNQANQEIDNLDEQLQMIIDLFPTGIEIKRMLGCSIKEGWDKDYYYCETGGGCIISNGTNEYELSYLECITDNKNSDRIGFMEMTVCYVSNDGNLIIRGDTVIDIEPQD